MPSSGLKKIKSHKTLGLFIKEVELRSILNITLTF